jgi:hypothetical protein
MSTAARQPAQHTHLISYQVSNKVPSSKDVRAYITRKVKAHSAAAEARKPAILTLNNVVRASTVFVDGKEVALPDLDEKGLATIFPTREGRPFFA